MMSAREAKNSTHQTPRLTNMSSSRELPLEAAVGFSGSVANGFHLHPDGKRRVYPLGDTIVVAPLPQPSRSKDVQEDPGDRASATFLHGHAGEITALTISKYGRFIASAERVSSGIADVIVWEEDVAVKSTYKEVRRLSLHTSHVVALAFSEDEKSLASVGGETDERVIMWDVHSGTALCGSPIPSGGKVCAVAFLHRSNTTFITAGEFVVSKWSYDDTNKRLSHDSLNLGTLKRHILSIAIDEDDDYAYLGTSSADILIVFLPQSVLKESFTLKRHISQGVHSLTLARNALLVGAGDGSLTLLSRRAKSGKILEFICCRDISRSGLTSIAVARTAQSDVTGLVYPKGCKTQYAKRKFVHFARLALSQDTAQPEHYRDNSETFDVYCGSERGELCKIEYCARHPLSGQCMLHSPVNRLETSHGYGITGITFPHDDGRYFATGGGPEIRVWETETLSSRSRIVVTPRTLNCLCISFMSDDETLLTGWDDGKIRAYDRGSTRLLFVAANAHERVTAVQGLCGTSGVISGGSEGNLRLWKVQNLNVITLEASMKEHRSKINAIALFNDDRSAVTASDDGSCVVWDVDRRARKVSFLGSTYFKALSIHPGERQIVTAGTDRKITWWDPADASVIRVIDDTKDSELVALDISRPDGASLAIAASDRRVRLYGYESAEVTHMSSIHASSITAVAFAPDGRRLLTASADGSVRVWSNPARVFADLGLEKELHIRRLTGEFDETDLPSVDVGSRVHMSRPA
jgi:WD40 repeat protein